MDKEKRIAELDNMIAILQARKEDKMLQIRPKGSEDDNEWDDFTSYCFNFGDWDIRIKEEPRRIPFDGSDAFNLTLQKFKNIYDNEDNFPDIFVCTKAGEYSVTLEMDVIGYEDLSKYWLKWNDTLKEWQPCNKVA